MCWHFVSRKYHSNVFHLFIYVTVISYEFYHEWLSEKTCWKGSWFWHLLTLIGPANKSITTRVSSISNVGKTVRIKVHVDLRTRVHNYRNNSIRLQMLRSSLLNFELCTVFITRAHYCHMHIGPLTVSKINGREKNRF